MGVCTLGERLCTLLQTPLCSKARRPAGWGSRRHGAERRLARPFRVSASKPSLPLFVWMLLRRAAGAAVKAKTSGTNRLAGNELIRTNHFYGHTAKSHA